jgi:hypothetical protein
MTLRIKFTIGVAVAAIVLPILVVQAQSEGEVVPPAAEESTQQQAETETTVPQEESTPAGKLEQDTAPAQEDVPTDAPAVEGEVLGETDTAAEEPAARTEPATTTSETESFVGLAASSTEATSTPPVEEPQPVEEPLVLQPGVVLSVNGNTLSAAITPENLTCKSCEKVLPELEVLTYYTEWYPNDGPISDYSQASVKSATQGRSVAELPSGASRDLTWSAEIAPGHYYFAVEVDPENTHGAYRLFRTEFAI